MAPKKHNMKASSHLPQNMSLEKDVTGVKKEASVKAVPD
jgi:hypothetical protein